MHTHMNMLTLFITHMCARNVGLCETQHEPPSIDFGHPYAHLSNKFCQNFKTKVTKPYSVTTPNRTRPRPNRTKPRRNRTKNTKTVPNNIENEANFLEISKKIQPKCSLKVNNTCDTGKWTAHGRFHGQHASKQWCQPTLATQTQMQRQHSDC